MAGHTLASAWQVEKGQRLVPPPKEILMDLKTKVNDVLHDLGEMATEAAKNGGEEAVKLANRAQALAKDCIQISDPQEKLQALESIGHAMKSGLAAIANKQARALLDNIIGRSLDFAKTLLGGALGLLR